VLRPRQIRVDGTSGIYISSAYRAAGLYPVVVEVGAMDDDSAGMRVHVKPGTAPQTATAACNFLVLACWQLFQ
jgi:hypothetical protein